VRWLKAKVAAGAAFAVTHKGKIAAGLGLLAGSAAATRPELSELLRALARVIGQ
jgi:hypothetical protein